MTKWRRFLPLLAVFFGVLGIAVCAAAILVVWSMGSRLTQANEDAFHRIDKTFSAVRGRVLSAQTRVQESKITTEDLRKKVRHLAGNEASERLAARLEVDERAERLVLGLEQAEQWLELSEDSIRGVQQALQIGSSLGAPVDVELVDPLVERFTALRRQLKQITKTVDGIRQRLSTTMEGEGLKARIDEDAQLVLSVVATIGEIDSRLSDSAENLADAQTKAQRLKSRTHDYIVLTATVAALIIVWMLVGQVSLYRNSWKEFRRRQLAA